MPELLRTAWTPVGAVHGGFEGKRDERFDLLGGHAGGLGHDDDAGPVEVGEDVDRQVQRLVRAVPGHQERDSDDQQSLSEGEADDGVEHGGRSESSEIRRVDVERLGLIDQERRCVDRRTCRANVIHPPTSIQNGQERRKSKIDSVVVSGVRVDGAAGFVFQGHLHLVGACAGRRGRRGTGRRRPRSRPTTGRGTSHGPGCGRSACRFRRIHTARPRRGRPRRPAERSAFRMFRPGCGAAAAGRGGTAS